MMKQKYNITELLEQLRMNGVVKVDDVEYKVEDDEDDPED